MYLLKMSIYTGWYDRRNTRLCISVYYAFKPNSRVFTICFVFFSPPFLQKGSSLVAPVHIVSEESPDKTNLGFIHAFVAAISVIIVSELGDKTFFIAAIMAMRYNRLTVLAGAMLALGLMTCLSGLHSAFFPFVVFLK